MGVIARAWGHLIEALDSDDPRRQMWASDKIMSSWIARDHPFAPAGRGFRGVEVPRPQVTFRWADGADRATDELERDGRTLVGSALWHSTENSPVFWGTISQTAFLNTWMSGTWKAASTAAETGVIVSLCQLHFLKRRTSLRARLYDDLVPFAHEYEGGRFLGDLSIESCACCSKCLPP